MKKENGYKIKLLKILEILRQDSDEERYLTTAEIISKLESQGIVCDRRTLFNDIKVLNEYGYEVLMEQEIGMPNKYCIVDRSFDVPELRILMDAVEAASFITPSKTKNLIDKIADLGGSHRAELLKNDTRFYNTTKHSNESIYYSINEIVLAIEQKKKVSFKYYDFNANKEKVFRKDGGRFYLSPLALVVNSDNYYLVGYNELYQKVLHYRVDRMQEVRMSHHEIGDVEEINNFNLELRQKQIFDMFGGEEEDVTIQVKKTLIDAVLDKFGENIELIDKDEEWAEFTATVQVSPTFLAWCCSFGNRLIIKSPASVVENVKEYIKEMMENYE